MFAPTTWTEMATSYSVAVMNWLRLLGLSGPPRGLLPSQEMAGIVGIGRHPRYPSVRRRLLGCGPIPLLPPPRPHTSSSSSTSSKRNKPLRRPGPSATATCLGQRSIFEELYIYSTCLTRLQFHNRSLQGCPVAGFECSS